MHVLFEDGRIINLDLVSCITPSGSEGSVLFRLADGKEISVSLDLCRLEEMISALVHKESFYRVSPKSKSASSRENIDFRDFPSVLEGENSPV